MPAKTALKSRILDEKDREILMILQKNGRESLTNVAKQVGLSIDSVNKRIKELQRKEVFTFGIYVDPRKIGFSINADIKIKLHNYTEAQKEKLISYLVAHPNVSNLFSTMGEFDLTCVLVAKNTPELDRLSNRIRQKFSGIIADWTGVLVLNTYKLEEYNVGC